METTSKLYIDELKQALNHNHAAVLIGSGFSLNADDVNPIEKHKMPMWYSLADSFCEKLGIEIKNPDYLKTNHYASFILADFSVITEQKVKVHGTDIELLPFQGWNVAALAQDLLW